MIAMVVCTMTFCRNSSTHSFQAPWYRNYSKAQTYNIPLALRRLYLLKVAARHSAS